MSLQQYLPNINNESDHIFINPQAKEPTFLFLEFLFLVELDGWDFEVAPSLIYVFYNWKLEVKLLTIWASKEKHFSSKEVNETLFFESL